MYVYIIYVYVNPATAAADAEPSKNLEAYPRPPATLGCSDCVYNEISIVPKKLISNLVSKLILEKKLRILKLGVFRL